MLRLMLRLLKAIAKIVNALCEYVTAAMLAVMTLVILVQVVCRFFGTGFDWSEEVARYLLICIVLLGTGIGVYRGGNIGIEAVVKALPPLPQRIVTIVMNLCCLLLFGEMVRYGWRVVKIATRQTSPSMQLPMSIPYGVIFIATIIIFMHLTVHLLDLLFVWKKPEAAAADPQPGAN